MKIYSDYFNNDSIEAGVFSLDENLIDEATINAQRNYYRQNGEKDIIGIYLKDVRKLPC